MRGGIRILLTTWSSLLAALLVFAGFLLGIDPQIGGQVGSYFSFGPSGDERLQEEILQDLEHSYYKAIDPATVQRGAIDGMLASLGDPYTIYLDPDEYARYQVVTSGEYSGVGMVVHLRDGLVRVVSVYDGSPAALAGIQEDDAIIAVDGIPTDGETLEQVVGRMKGPEGTTVTLSVWRPGPQAGGTTTTTQAAPDVDGGSSSEDTATTELGDPTVDLSLLPAGGERIDYPVTRRVIDVPVTDSRILTVAGEDVALISLYQFTSNAATELRSEVKTAVDTDKVVAIILDLRGNPGGLLTAAVDVASIFIDTGAIVSTEGLHSREEVLSASGLAYAKVPLYVLTDENTASASEIVSGALQDYHRATLVGETTFGKGLVQTLEPLSNGGAIKVTTAVYLTPSGRDINATGIAPDVVAPDDPDTPDVDETVQATLGLISSSISPN